MLTLKIMIVKLSGCLFIEDYELLEKYNGNWNNNSNNIIRKELDCKPIYNKKFLKTKIRFYGDEATEFCNKKYLK